MWGVCVFWIVAALAINWLARSMPVERFAAEYGVHPSYHLEDFIALVGSLLLAWFLGLLGRQVPWWQNILVLIGSIAMPIILTILLFTVGCRISVELDIHGACK
jgi:hypothetical protein